MDNEVRNDTVKKLVEATKKLDRKAAEDALNRFYSMCVTDGRDRESGDDGEISESKLVRIIYDAYYPFMHFSYSPVVRMPIVFRDDFVDLVFIPKPMERVPLILIEIEIDKSANEALTKMKEGNYEGCLLNFDGVVTYLGVNFDTADKKFTFEFSVGRKISLF
ncbi:MAG: hypothetical protein LUD29_04265 [Clostridia bacterium]|nr:hypothetical protein [Clostridia bacterium]